MPIFTFEQAFLASRGRMLCFCRVPIRVLEINILLDDQADPDLSAVPVLEEKLIGAIGGPVRCRDDPYAPGDI